MDIMIQMFNVSPYTITKLLSYLERYDCKIIIDNKIQSDQKINELEREINRLKNDDESEPNTKLCKNCNSEFTINYSNKIYCNIECGKEFIKNKLNLKR